MASSWMDNRTEMDRLLLKHKMSLPFTVLLILLFRHSAENSIAQKAPDYFT